MILTSLTCIDIRSKFLYIRVKALKWILTPSCSLFGGHHIINHVRHSRFHFHCLSNMVHLEDGFTEYLSSLLASV